MPFRSTLAVSVDLPERAVNPRRRLALYSAAIVVGVISVVAWLKWQYLPARMERQAVAVTDEGLRAWREGDVRRAEIAFESARAMNPRSTRPILLHARLQLQRGERSKGAETFQYLLNASQGAERERILVTYHDALVATGWWEQRATLTVRELLRNGDNPILLCAAVESVRLARWTSADLERAITGARLAEPAGAMLRAQSLLNAGDVAGARRALSSPQPVAPLVSVQLCRLWLRLGDAEAARLALGQVNTQLDDLHVQLGLLALAADEPEQARQAVRELCANPRLTDEGGAVLEAMLSELFSFPDRRIADQLTQRFGPQAGRLEPTLVGALWLYCSLSDADRSTAVWAEQLGKRFATWPINLTGRKLDQQVALFAINSLPLTRLVIDGLVAALPNADPARTTPPTPPAS